MSPITPGTGLPTVRHGLLPDLAPEGMGGAGGGRWSPAVGRMRPLAVFCSAGCRRRIAAPTAAPGASLFVCRASWVSACLKVYSGSGSDTRLVQELGGLQAIEPVADRLVREVGDGLEQRKPARPCRSTEATWRRCRSARGQPIDPRRQHGLHRGRDRDRRSTGCVRRYRPRSPASTLVSTSIRTISSRKNGLPCPTRSCLSGRSTGIVGAEQRVEQRPGALGRQRVQAHLAVDGSCRPTVCRYSGSIGHEQQDARGHHAVDEAVEDLLGLGVDPVEVLDDQAQRLSPARGQEHLPGRRRASAGGAAPDPRCGTDGPAAGRRADRGREAGSGAARHRPAPPARRARRTSATSSPGWTWHRPLRSSMSGAPGVSFVYGAPPAESRRQPGEAVGGLADEARLADARLPDDADDLAVPLLGERRRAPRGRRARRPGPRSASPSSRLGRLLQTEDPPGVTIAAPDALEREAPRQERRHRARDDDGARRIDAGQRLEERPRWPPCHPSRSAASASSPPTRWSAQ